MKKKHELILILLYAVLAAICVYLNFFDGEGIRLSDILVNIIMFLVVGGIFIHAIRCFKKTKTIEKSLEMATQKIKDDFADKQELLWDTYKDAEDLFDNAILRECFDEYKHEMKRLELIEDNDYKCSIEDYINRDVIDKAIKRNILNLIPGTMTGLGILGTFVGLTIGLQNFSTGTADEISDSIGPLMDGIKVAFHTSVYGMIFSLVFNYVYKNKLDNAYNAVDVFLNEYEKYVMPDVHNDSISRILAYQKQQVESIAELVDSMGEKIAQQISEVMAPHFEQMNETINSFATAASKSQVEGVGTLVDKFVEEMNQSLGDNFKELGNVIEETCNWQKLNNEYMHGLLEELGGVVTDVQEVNELSEKTVESLSGYIEHIETLQGIINENFMSVNLQIESNTQMLERQEEYIKTLVEYEKNISKSSSKFTSDMVEQIATLQQLENEIASSTKANIDAITKTSEDCSNAIATAAQRQIQSILSLSNSATGDMDRAAQELARVSQQLNTQMIDSINRTFDSFDKNLAEITRHLSGTISEVESATQRVPKVVSAAYEEMEKSFNKMQEDVDALVYAMDALRRNTNSLVKILEQDE